MPQGAMGEATVHLPFFLYYPDIGRKFQKKYKRMSSILYVYDVSKNFGVCHTIEAA